MRKPLVFLAALLFFSMFRVGLAQAILPIHPAPPEHDSDSHDKDIEWGPLLTQASLFLGIQHTVRFATEPGSREQLKGPFIRDYLDSVRGLRGWGDGDDFLTNYIGHPMQGAVTSFLFVSNDKRGRRLEFGSGSAYWRSRLRAMAFSAAYSTQFEIGPISEASLGNLGSPKVPNTMGNCDLVVTPIGGFAWQVTEDALDRYVVRWLEERTRPRIGKILVRGVLNPSRSFSNLMQLRFPWHRDTRPGVDELSQMD